MQFVYVSFVWKLQNKIQNATFLYNWLLRIVKTQIWKKKSHNYEIQKLQLPFKKLYYMAKTGFHSFMN